MFFLNTNRIFFYVYILYCAHLIVTLAIAEVRLHLGNTKKNKFSFGISLDLHYR